MNRASRASGEPPIRSPILPAVLLAIVALATYWNGLGAPFVWDDETAIVTNQTIHSVWESLTPPLETPMTGRPIVNLSLALNYATGGLGTTGYHLSNLLVHVASALVLFGIVRRTLLTRDVFEDVAFRDGVALLAALVWMVHPLVSETVDYVTQRTESMMGLCFLLTLYAAIRARAPRHQGRWLIASVVSCAIGMATKESMVVAPVAVVLYDLVFEFNSAEEAVAARAPLYVGLAATWVELGAIMWCWPRSTVGTASVGRGTYLLNQTQMIVHYLHLVVWPSALVLDYGVPHALAARSVLPQAVVIIAMAAATVLASVRWPAVGFLGAMFFLTLAPTSSFVPIVSEVGAERRMYLPLAALVVLVVTLAGRLVDRLRTGRPARAKTIVGVAVGTGALLVAALAARTVSRNREYATPRALWESVVARRPQGRARSALAHELAEAGRYDEAFAQWREAVRDYPDARAGLGTELLVQGHTEEAITVLDAFVQANPSASNRVPARFLIAQGYVTLATRAMERQDIALAADQAKQSLQLDPNNADAHNVLGAALASQSRLAEAIAEFQAAVRLNPRHPSAASNLARATVIMRERR